MTEDQANLLVSVLSDTFGATCSLTLGDAEDGIIVEVKRAMVVVYVVGVEVETSTGPQMVEGWSVGVAQAGGGFREMSQTTDYWMMAAAVVQSLSFQVVFDYRAQMQDSLLEEQYE